MKKNLKKGAALIFTFMLLVLFAAFSVSMYEISVSQKNLSASIAEVKEVHYNVNVGVGYIVRQINSFNLNNQDSSILAWLNGQVGIQQYVGNQGGWFRMDSVATSGQYDYLIKVSGGIPDTSVAATQQKSLSSFLNVAYAAGEVINQYEIIIGPLINSSGGNGLYLGGSGTVSFASNANITVYPGGTGTILAQSPASVTANLGANVSVQSLTNPQTSQIQTIANSQVTAATNLVTSLPAAVAAPSPFTSLAAGTYNYNTNINLTNNNFVTIGDPTGATFTTFNAPQLNIKNGSNVVLGPGVYQFSSLQVENNANLILDTTNGPVYLIINGSQIEVENNGSIIVFKSSTIPNIGQYNVQANLANQGQPLGAAGQQIGGLFLTSGATMEVENNALLGGFATGNQTQIWSNILGTLNSGTGSQVSVSSNQISLNSATPNASAFQVWGSTVGGVQFENNGTTVGTLVFSSIGSITVDNNALINGMIAAPNVTTKFQFKNNSNMAIDPNVSPFPPTPIQGTYAMKHIRQVQ